MSRAANLLVLVHARRTRTCIHAIQACAQLSMHALTNVLLGVRVCVCGRRGVGLRVSLCAALELQNAGAYHHSVILVHQGDGNARGVEGGESGAHSSGIVGQRHHGAVNHVGGDGNLQHGCKKRLTNN